MSVTIPKTVRNVGELNHRHGDVVAWTFGFEDARRKLYRPLVEA